jgi:hypothetical protein
MEKFVPFAQICCQSYVKHVLFFNAHDRNSQMKAEYNFLITQLKDSMKNVKLKREKQK